MLDIRAVADVAHENGIPLIVDNTIATPYLIKPFEHGADIIVHSATKFLGGHGTVIGGIIVDGGTFEWSKNVDKFPGLTVPDPSYHGASYTAAVGDGLAYIIKARVQLLRDLGAAISPQSAWLLIQGIETLSLRIERHVQNAQEIAEWLENREDVASVNYSGLPTSPWYAAANKYAPKGVGAVLSFELKGGVAAGREFVNSLSLFSHLANIGDVRSLVIHPASTTHSQLTPEQQLTTGVTPGPRAPLARSREHRRPQGRPRAGARRRSPGVGGRARLDPPVKERRMLRHPSSARSPSSDRALPVMRVVGERASAGVPPAEHPQRAQRHPSAREPLALGLEAEQRRTHVRVLEREQPHRQPLRPHQLDRLGAARIALGPREPEVLESAQHVVEPAHR